MTPRVSASAFSHARLSRTFCLRALVSCSLLTATVVAGCGGQSTEPLGSTDTGNPPVIAETKLRVTASEDGVVVSGEKGAVTASASIEVTNLTTGESETTKANRDGTFEVTIAGAISDEYRIEAELNGKSTKADVPASAVDVELDGHTFLLESSEGYEFVSGTSLTVMFDEGKVNVNAGCNAMSGPYTLCDSGLCVSELSSTAIGCDADRMEQDTWIADFFTSKPKLEYAAPRLTLVGPDATFALLDREEANPDRSLMERLWNIDTLISGGTASNTPFQNAATVQFEDDFTFLAFDTCNHIVGTYEVRAQTIMLNDVSKDDRYCDTDLGVQQHIGQVFSSPTLKFTIEAQRLTLTAGDVGISAVTE